MYNSAVSRISLRDKVEEVRGDENFVGFSDLPDDLVNATIAVEDHRFRVHGSIDLISIGRAISANIKAKDAVEGGGVRLHDAADLVDRVLGDQIRRIEDLPVVAVFYLAYHIPRLDGSGEGTAVIDGSCGNGGGIGLKVLDLIGKAADLCIGVQFSPYGNPARTFAVKSSVGDDFRCRHSSARSPTAG